MVPMTKILLNGVLLTSVYIIANISEDIADRARNEIQRFLIRLPFLVVMFILIRWIN